MSWIIYSFLANLGAIALEYLYRLGFFSSFWKALPFILPVAIAIQFGLYGAFSKAPSYLLAWAVFFTGNAILRSLVSFVLLNEPVEIVKILGLVLIGLGAYLIKLT